MHRSRHSKECNPWAYFLNKLRNRAKERGITCTLTYEQFKKFCDETNLLEFRGKTLHCLSIDRIEEHLGYVEGNLQTLTVSENSKKQRALEAVQKKIAGSKNN